MVYIPRFMERLYAMWSPWLGTGHTESLNLPRSLLRGRNVGESAQFLTSPGHSLSVCGRPSLFLRKLHVGTVVGMPSTVQIDPCAFSSTPP